MPPSAAAIANRTPHPAGPSPRTATARAIASTPPTCAQKMTRSEPSVRLTSGPTKSPTPHARLAPNASRRGPKPRLCDFGAAGGGDRVELVRVVEHRGLGRPRPARIMVGRHAVEELRELARGQSLCALLDQAQAEVDVTEEPALVRDRERRAARQLDRTAGVVEERRGEQQVGPQARVQLRGL